LIYISYLLTILGITSFLQWSLLSNITILENNNITGEIKDIGAFFISLKTTERELITIPNSVILQKNIKYSPQP
jgi:small-conductance mechanosensitive channel